MSENYLVDTCIYDRDVYESKSPSDEESKKGILRTIKGPVAEWDSVNRNNRRYSEKLWDSVLESPYVKEQLKYHTLYGEANHPQDRYEIDLARVSHSITELWKVPASNQIYATINILDTPLGRILNTLYESGGIIGYSSRAGGKLINKGDYIEVDEKTYSFVTFDAVPFPSVESARPSEITEGVKFKHKLPQNVHENLCNIIECSSDNGKEVIKEFLSELANCYDFSVEESLLESSVNNKLDHSNEESLATMQLLSESGRKINLLKAENQALKVKENSLINENKSLKSTLDSYLQQVSQIVSDTASIKESENREIDSYINTINELNNKVSILESELEDREADLDYIESLKNYNRSVSLKNKALNAKLDKTLGINESFAKTSDDYKQSVMELEKELSQCKEMIEELEESKSRVEGMNSKLLEAVSLSNNEINSLKEDIKNLQEDNSSIMESSSSIEFNYKKNIEKLNESIDILKDDIEDKEKSMDKLNVSLESKKREIKRLNEEIDRVFAKMAEKDNYISECQNSLVSIISDNYGIDARDVMRELSNGFTKDDVYSVCESIATSYSKKNGMFVPVSESVEFDNRNTEDTHIARNISFGNRRGI